VFGFLSSGAGPIADLQIADWLQCSFSGRAQVAISPVVSLRARFAFSRLCPDGTGRSLPTFSFASSSGQHLFRSCIPEYEAKRYEGRVKEGGILVSVHCDDSDWVSKAKDILKRSGAEDISSAGEKAASTHGVADDPAVSPSGVRVKRSEKY
jgi:hypothetical protein